MTRCPENEISKFKDYKRKQWKSYFAQTLMLKHFRLAATETEGLFVSVQHYSAPLRVVRVITQSSYAVSA